VKRSSVPTVVLVAAVALVALLVYGVVQKQAGPGAQALDAAVAKNQRPEAPKRALVRPLLNAKGERRIADLEGKVVVLNFFASWCQPCQEEAPVLERTQAALRKGGAGTVLGITYHDAADAAVAFSRRNKLDFPLLRDPGDTLFDAYGNRGIPETFVLDRKGKVVALSRGQVDQAFLDGAIAKAKADA
jgi:cytochrome c biogenesis protein CcmG/thiol:disulfide interchange protein DsbE